MARYMKLAAGHAAAFAMGLVADDKEWDLAMEEANNSASAAQMRSLFVVILTHCGPMNPSLL